MLSVGWHAVGRAPKCALVGYLRRDTLPQWGCLPRAIARQFLRVYRAYPLACALRLAIVMLRIGMVALMLLSFGCDGNWPGNIAPDPIDNVPTGGTGGVGDSQLGNELEELANAINFERTSRGLDPVALEVELNCAAERHSDDIGAAGICSHDGTDGSGPSERVSDCGGSGWSGEIVACGQRTPASAVQGWLDSPGHRAIMLEPSQRTMGVGVHQFHWTAVFDR